MTDDVTWPERSRSWPQYIWSLITICNIMCSSIMVKPGNCPWQLQLSSYYYYYSFFLLCTRSLADKHDTYTGMDPNGPKNTDPVSVTLTYFSRSQTHFCAKNPKIQIHITLSFMIGFWWNLVWMDSYRRHVGDLLFDDLDLLLQVKLVIGLKFFVTGLAKSRRRRIILATLLDGDCQGPLRIEV